MENENTLNFAVDVDYTVDSNFDSDKFIKMRLRICHDGVNNNGSHFEISDIKSAEATLANIPVLANVVFDEEGNPQFGSHDMTVEKSKIDSSERKVIYKETPIGVVPESCNPTVEEYNGRQYAFADAYIWKGYSNYAEDIINRDEDIKLSMEITVDDFAYDADKKVTNINKFRYRGITFLGNNKGTGMKEAMATINFSDNYKEEMLNIMGELKEVLETYSIEKRGETEMEDTKLIQETEQEQQEVFDNETVKTPNEPVTDFVVNFTVSHEDIRCGLYQMIDGENFIERVYDDYFIYYSLDDMKYYKQKYSVNEDLITLDGEKEEVFVEMLTQNERDAVEKMRSDFEALKTEVEQLREFKATVDKNEHDNQVQAILDKWSEHLSGNEEFEQLKATDYAEIAVDNLETKCKCIFADSKAVFSEVKPVVKDTMVRLTFSDESNIGNQLYGGLFDEYIKN